MKYILENAKEFKRLEKQSQSSAYDHSIELKPILSLFPRHILDAGCGSGAVSRFLSEWFPNASIKGCDFSPDRIRQAQQAAPEEDYPNLQFTVQDLEKLGFQKSEFDLIVCRYVMQHLEEDALKRVLFELHRCLMPQGTLVAVDADGLFHNLYPMPPRVAETLDLLDRSKKVDLRVGRKLPFLFVQAGFIQVTTQIQTLSFQSHTPEMEEEIALIEERLNGAQEFLSRLLKSKTKAKRFRDEYLKALDQKGAVLFLNKFIVQGSKSLPVPRLRLVKPSA